MSGELAAERWSPAQRVESVLISILSLLDDAEVSSPANVDAAVMLRKDPVKYHATVKANVDASRKLAPPGFTMPVEDAPTRDIEKDDDDFWMESDADSDPFGGSDSDSDLDLNQISASEDDDDDDDDDDSEDTDEQHQRRS